ncbi:MAG: NFACT RNA binding domain-containing protein [Candidatus Choladocola sp.]|nr:NFACT RNA binding domain-containing protein [Candidatus Choladocola sp.]
MALDGIVISNIVAELNQKLLGSRISKIAQPETDELQLTLKGPVGQFRLLLSASASLPLIYLTSTNKPSPMTAPNFCMLLRKHVGNGRLTRIWQPGLERIIHFEIEHFNEMGDLCHKDLILELMGKHSNLIFCDENGMIIDSIKHVSVQTSSVREVLPGRPYFIAVTQDKYDPLNTTEEEFCSTVFSKPAPLAKAIYTTYTGISPVIAEELCHRASLESSQSAKTIEGLARVHLYHQFDLMMDDIRTGSFSPSVIYDDKKVPTEFASLPLTLYRDLECVSYESPSEMLEQYYAMRNTVTRIRQKSSDLRRIATTALDRCRKKYELQKRQLKDTEKRDKYKVYGELIHTYGYEVQDGAGSFEALNYYTNEMITIPLDKTLTVQENARKYFDKYNKLKRTYEALSDHIQETEAEIVQLESICTFMDMALSEEDLVQVKEELTDAGYIRRKYTGKKAKITSRPFHYVSSDGYDMYVGKNNYQNDELTFKIASGNDWWFHAKGAPGSHVIVKTGGNELPDRTFEEAARLAAHYSKNRNAEKVEIDYVEKKHVKKPNGAKPGFVVYYTNYSMMIDSDISQIRLVSD